MADRLFDSLARLVRALTARIDYLALYHGKVVAQSSDMATVDVQPDAVDPATGAARVPGLSGVPLKPPFPGATVQVQPGAFVLVGWENGDPRRPYALPLYDAGGVALQINLTATTVTISNSANGSTTIGGGKVALGGTSGMNPQTLALNAMTIDPYSGAPLQAVGNTKTYAGDV